MFNLKNLAIVFSVGTSLLLSSSATAQLVPDPTLGRETSTVQRNVNIRGTNSDRITGGTRRGRNLFHSFQKFNVGRGRGVYFTNPNGVQNILTRVTGGERSNILGTLGVLGPANLYLINPNGILFGKNATLDLRGSFYATTADGIKLGENGSFSATDPAGSNLLTVQPGALFQNAMRNYLATIENRANLVVRKGQDLTLEGDRVISTGQIIAPGGAVTLEAVNGDLSVGNIDTTDISGGGDVSLRATGDITLNGTIDVSGGEFDFDSVSPSQLSEIIGNGGNVILSSSENITLNFYSNIYSFGLLGGNITIDSGGDISSGDISFPSNNFFVLIDSTSFGSLDSTSFGTKGTGGNVKVRAKSLSMNNTILGSFTRGKTNTGDVSVDTESLRLENGAQIGAGTFGEGNAGHLTVRAIEIVASGTNADNFPSGLLAQVNPGATGNGGKLTVKTHTLRLENKAQISSATLGKGNAGHLNVQAHSIVLGGDVVVKGFVSFQPFADAFTGLFTKTKGPGNGGDLIVNTNSLEIGNEARISAASSGNGQSGNISITANTLNIFGSSRLVTETQGRGSGGNLTVNTDSLRLQNQSEISAGTTGLGNAGRLNLTAQDILVTGSSRLITETQRGGNGGSLRVKANSLQVSDRGLISSASTSNGKSRDISIRANTVQVLNGGRITVNSQSPNNPDAFINISADSLTLARRGAISATAASSQGGDINIALNKRLVLGANNNISTNSGSDLINGNGGDISINTPFILALSRNNKITANADRGRGGNIDLTTNAILGYPQYLNITASSQRGIDGRVSFNNIETNLNSGVVEAPITPIDVNTLIAQDTCTTIASGSSFVVKPKGGLPPSPTDLLNTQRPVVEWTSLPDRPLETRVSTRSRVSSEEEKTLPSTSESNVDKKPIVVVRPRSSDDPLVIQQARGMIKKPDGTIVLTAYPTEGISSNLSVVTHPNCS
ncbi:MAG: filamentous hemagglutinin N-terminal domain-containing protein [Prochloraceae cyanobacterium]|nr:filamentous hemagglutinin N-terminal domain-containing protein [Prochloraceae cyanobacterium]